jgi:hypothetical protein
MLQLRVASLVPPRSPKGRLMMLKILTVLKQQESTLEERTIPNLLKSIGVGIILSSTVSLFQLSTVAESFLKK